MHCKSAARTFLATLGMLAALSPAHAHDKGVGLLLLGDGKISREPKAGNVFACQTSFRGGGAQALGPWAQNGVWKPDAKMAVNGAIAWPNAAVSIALEGNQRVVRANGLPNHPTGIFPVDRNDPAYKYDRNPNSIREQSVLLRLPAQPIASGRPSCVPMGMIGFSLTGVAIFNALDAMGRDAAAYEILDACSGHPERDGTYHYHDYSTCMTDAAGKAGKHSDLVGYALDGFGIYGPKADGNRRVKNADLDACHGHSHEIVWDWQRKLLYHYHFTDEYPYTLGCFNGTPAAAPRPAPAVARSGPNPAPGAPPPQGANPRDRGAIEAAAKELGIDASRLGQALGPPPPDFARAAGELGIPEQRLRDAMQRARAGR